MGGRMSEIRIEIFYEYLKLYNLDSNLYLKKIMINI